MIHAIRNFLSSKLGMVVALAFLGLIALAFAGLDVTSSGTFGGVSGSDRVAIVGDERISTSELQTNINVEVDGQRSQNPLMTREAFIAGGGMEQVLDDMVNRLAMAEFGRDIGLRAGNALVDHLLIRQFGDAAGNFNEATYRATLDRLNFSDRMMRSYMESTALQQQVVTPILMDTQFPESIARRYAALQRERRVGEIGTLLAVSFAPDGDPSDEQLDRYFEENRANYLQPERRVVRYIPFDAPTLGVDVTPSDEEIAARYQQDIEIYEAAELRGVTTLVIATQTDANAIREEIEAGATLAQAASSRGLETNRLAPMQLDELATRESEAVAEAAFALDRGEISQPVRGRLGFYLLRLDEIRQKEGRSLAQASAEISQALEVEKRLETLLETSERIEDAMAGGANLLEIAEVFGLTVQTSPELLANGAVFNSPGEVAPEFLAPIIQTAFAMEEDEPQLDQIVPGRVFMAYEVNEIFPAAPPPREDFEDELIAAWRQAEGAAAAGEAAERIMERMGGGMSLAQALEEEEADLPSPTPVDERRDQLGRPPLPVALMFSMAQGSVKKLELGSDAGYVVVKLDTIEVTPLEDDDPQIQLALSGLSGQAVIEQRDQFMKAVQEEVGVELNQSTIDTLKEQLSGF